MEFNSNERTSIACVLIAMMNIDKNVDVREVLYFRQIQNVIAITDDEFKRGKEQNLLLSLLTLKSMNDTQKLILGKMLLEMVNADGKIVDEEAKLLYVIAHATGLNEVIQKLNAK